MAILTMKQSTLSYRDPAYVPSCFWRAIGVGASGGYSIHLYDEQQTVIGKVVKTVKNEGGKWSTGFSFTGVNGDTASAANMATLLSIVGQGYPVRPEKRVSNSTDKTVGNMPVNIARLLAAGAVDVTPQEAARAENRANGIAPAPKK
jgi:hypothetical protein